MKTALALALMLLTATLFAADDPRIAEGIALHDQGKYDEAIAKYKAVLADDPGSVLAVYELAFSYQAKGEYKECIAAVEPASKVKHPLQAQLLTVLGNCLDHGGERQRAIGTYRKGLKIAPNDPMLLFNLAVSVAADGKRAEAIGLLKKELVIMPGHAGGHYALGQVFEEENFRGAAILEYLRMLAIESHTPRAKDAASRLVALLSLGFESKDGKNINVIVNPDSRQEEGDFGMWEMMLAFAGAVRVVEENQKLTEFEKTRLHLATSLQMLVEAPVKGKNYSAQQNVPFVAALGQKKLLDALAGIAVSPLGLDGTDVWLKANEKSIAELAAFVRTFGK